MPNKRNIDNLEKLKHELGKCDNFILLDCSGIGVKEITQIRRKLEETDARLKIYKNRLIRIAVNEVKQGLDIDRFLKGPTALVFMDNEPVKTIKFLYNYIKDKQKPQFKGGFVFERVCGKDELPTLAQLRSLNEERAIFISVLQGPLTALVNTLQTIPQNFVMTIDAIRNKKSELEKEA